MRMDMFGTVGSILVTGYVLITGMYWNDSVRQKAKNNTGKSSSIKSMFSAAGGLYCAIVVGISLYRQEPVLLKTLITIALGGLVVFFLMYLVNVFRSLRNNDR
jgi:hypothetical protein